MTSDFLHNKHFLISEKLSKKITFTVDRFGNLEWFISGILALIVLILFAQILFLFGNSKEYSQIELSPIIDMKYIEFNEKAVQQRAETKELSDKIIEKEKLKEEINWKNAVDPTFDIDQKYLPKFQINYSESDYPASARKSSLPKVVVTFQMLIGADGSILDLKIINIKSQNNIHKPFEEDFIVAVRKIILKQSKLISRPYSSNGKAKKFIWENKFEFILR